MAVARRVVDVGLVARGAERPALRRVTEQRTRLAAVGSVAGRTGQPRRSGARAGREREPVVDQLQSPPGRVRSLRIHDQRGVDVVVEGLADLVGRIQQLALLVAGRADRRPRREVEVLEAGERFVHLHPLPALGVQAPRPVARLAVHGVGTPHRPRTRAVLSGGARHAAAHVAVRAVRVPRANRSRPEGRVAGLHHRWGEVVLGARAVHQVGVVEPGAARHLVHRRHHLHPPVRERRDEEADPEVAGHVRQGVAMHLVVFADRFAVPAVGVPAELRPARIVPARPLPPGPRTAAPAPARTSTSSAWLDRRHPS